MKPEELDTIIAAAAPTFSERIGELHEHILEAASEALEASQERDDGGKPKVTVTLRLVIGLNNSPPWWQTTGSVGVTFKSEGPPVSLDDPNQPGLFDRTDNNTTIQIGNNPPVPFDVANVEASIGNAFAKSVRGHLSKRRAKG